MNEKESLQKEFFVYLTSVHRKTLSCLFDTLADPSPENFHQLRISLKRLRFIGRTLMNFGQQGMKRRLKPYREVFRLAGQIRQHQVHVNLLDRHGILKHAQTDPRKMTGVHGKLLRKWPDATGRFLADAVKSYPFIGRSILAWKTTEDEFVDEVSERIIARFGNEIPDNKLHDSRKLLKGMLYSCEISPALRKAFNERFNLRKAITLEDAIGDWHDLDMLLQSDQKGKGLYKKKTRDHLQREITKEHKKIQSLTTQLIRKGLTT